MATPLRLGILGSCVSRDMAELHRECTVAFYVARQSLISAASPPTEVPETVDLPSAFQRRMVVADLRSEALDLLEDHAPDLDVLVIDLVDERLGVVPLAEGAFATDSQELKESGVKDLLRPVSDDVELGTPEHFRRWKDAARAVLARLEAAGLRDRSVVLRVPFASRTRDGVSVPPYMQRSAAEWDDAFRPYYAFLRELGLPVVELPPELALGDADHRWGLSPYHFVPEAYAWLLAELRRVVGLDEPSEDGDWVDQQYIRVPLSLPVAGIRNPATAGTVRLPLHLRADVTRWRLRVTNLDERTGRLAPGRVEISGMWVGRASSPGAFDAAPSRRMGRRRLPGGKRGLVTPWFDDPIGDGDWMVSLGWSADPGRRTVVTLADAYRGPDPSTADRPEATGLTASRYVPLSWAVEVETCDAVPVVVAWGDERCLSAATAAELGDSALSRLAREMRAVPVHSVFPGTGLALWADYQSQWEHFAVATPATEVFHVMGMRDVIAGASLERLRELFTDTLPRLENSFGPHVNAVLLDTPPPSPAGLSEVVTAYNDWLLTTFAGPVYRLQDDAFTKVRDALVAEDPITSGTPLSRGSTS
ncbi:DUF6270 domain-containing protein [Knoellia sp. S7-12]|uniref:DUF6270 domain-containing protein n=1 Tax=Knoellia sp. S7-12 TaxID=3126698 RepID=UPI003367DCA2